jgi:hypothetical protein
MKTNTPKVITAVMLPVMTGTPGEITIPVTVKGFNNVSAVSLSIQYDPEKLTYKTGQTLNYTLAFGSYETGVIRIGGCDTQNTNLKDGTVICDLVFDYQGGETDLTFITEDGQCELSDPDGKVLDCQFINGRLQ